MEEEDYRKIPEYVKMLKIEEVVKKKSEKLDQLEAEVG